MSKQTTAGLVAVIAAVSMSASAAMAADPPLQISYPTDGSLSCEGLLTETARMDQLLGASADAAGKAEGTGRAAEMGTSLAINGALYSGALGRVPGLGMFANAAGNAAKKKAAADAARAEELARTAQSRRAVLSGIYQGKNCQAQQVAAAVAAATAQTATAGTVTPVAATTVK